MVLIFPQIPRTVREKLVTLVHAKYHRSMFPSHLLSFNFSIPIPNPNPNFLSSQPSLRSLHRRRRRISAGGSQWDSNAEDGEFPKGRGRKWWSEESEYDFGDDLHPFEEDGEDIWDKIWIFKVFKAYGYMLPAIIASMLLATGPKAFLLALALPLGQSAISLAFEKLWERVSEGPRRTKHKTKKKPFAKSSSNYRKKGKEERSSQYKGTNGYQSWVSEDFRVADKVSGLRKSSFGGWDELDSQKESIRRRSPTIGGSGQAEMANKGKLSKRGRYRDAPLFLRLLIAVFPFLSSWMRIL